MQQSKQQIATKVLFWGAFGIFLMVSIPHIAWVFRQYEPQDPGVAGFMWWVLAYGFAIAIDGVIGWLSHIKSEGTTWKDQGFIWTFIVVLVLMSWYFNWVFSEAHDPSKQVTDVWRYVLTNQLWFLPSLTVGQLTPVVISALPVFIIAYTFILQKVNAMKTTAAKSLADLQQEAGEAEQRAEAEKRIRDAQKTQKNERDIVGNAFGFAKKVRQEAQNLVGEKRDPESKKLHTVLELFRGTPTLLSDENAELAETTILDVLHLKHPATARFWRIKAAHVLTQEQAQNPDENQENTTLTVGDNHDETLDTYGTSLDEQSEEPGYVDEGNVGVLRDTDVRNDGQEMERIRMVSSLEPSHLMDEKDMSSGSRGRRYITFEDASDMTGYAIDTLKRKANDGEIKRHPTDRNRLLFSSIQGLRNPKRSESIHALQAIHNRF
ncbi:MAG: hypothetical protein NVS4B11_26670 [Ktedonobacteraceae bacterium]